MANQIVVSAGAKVRNLDGVLTGTSGVVNSLPINASNGIPQLDVNGKILVSQLPNSVMEYQGVWNANTNTPTLTNGGAFNQGDVYLCNVAGTTNFGAGPISFIVGDQAIYSGTIWQKAGGATGTVTSVAVTESGDSLNITGSPITTSGTINIGFNGTNLQYVNGAGNLTTFPTLITSIGLSMPSAFSVANSPLTANGTIAVTGAGYASQYIRGDGTLADFPSSGGGGSSVSYYLNGGTSQGTIGGTTYYEMSKTAVIGTGVDFAKSGDGLIVAFLTDANDPAQLNIPAGNWNYEIYASMSANGGTPQMYAELYKYDGTTFTLISTSTNEILYDGTNLNLYTFGMTVPATSLTLTDRLAIKLYATNSGGKTTTVHTQDSHLCQIITTFSTGITALNGLTAQVQYFQTGTSGTDFNISSTTATHTFNIPDASATARGLITTGTQTIAGIKTFSSGINVDYIGVTGDISMDGSFSLKQVAYGTLQSGYTNLSGQTNGLRVGLFGGYNALLNFSTSGSYTYTFPAATGTIALTSDIPSLAGYVTLATTQTITGAKTFSGAVTLTSSVTTNNLTFANSGFFLTLQPPTLSVNRTVTLPNGTGTLALTSDLTGGTVTSVAALTIGTTGTDLSSTVATSTTTPVITLNVPTASATNRGALSSADWTTFNNKQSALTNPVTGTGTTNYLPKFTGTSTIGNSGITDDGTTVTFNSRAATFTIGNLSTTIGANSGNWISNSLKSDLANNSTLPIINGKANSANNAYTIIYNHISDGSSSNFLGLGFYGADNLLKLTASGNLGLGVTPSAWGSGQTAFQFGSRGGLSADGSTTYVDNNRYFNGTNNIYTQTAAASIYAQGGGSHIWFNAPSGTAGAAITFTQAMTLTAAGRLLLGTTTESTYLLDVNGTGRFTGVLSLPFNPPATTGGMINIRDGAANGSNTSFGGVFFNSSPGSDYSIGKLSENANGFLQIRNANTGAELLRLASTGAATFSSSVTATGYNVANTGGSIQTVDAGAYVSLFGATGSPANTVIIGTASTERMRITSTGNVGIGTSSPSSLLTVAGATDLAWSASTSKLQILRSGSQVRINNYESGSGSSIAMAWDGGNVLIGTTTDGGTHKLQVNGSIIATGFFESSDSRLKTLIQDNYQTKGIASITPKLYTKNGKVELGYYAQDFVGVLDSAVSKGSDDMLSLSYREVHTAKIYALEQRIKELETKLN